MYVCMYVCVYIYIYIYTYCITIIIARSFPEVPFRERHWHVVCRAATNGPTRVGSQLEPPPGSPKSTHTPARPRGPGPVEVILYHIICIL